MDYLLDIYDRLGLGATVSKTDALTAREAVRLKGKLAGTKRPRDEEKEPDAQDDEDDDESRSVAISKKKSDAKSMGALALGLGKKAKGKGRALDELASGNAMNEENDIHDKELKKPKERHRSQEGADRNSPATPSRPNPFVMPKTPPPVPSVINLISPSPTRNITAAEASSPPKKKKKRRRKKPAVEPQSDGDDEEWHGFSLDETDSLNIIDGTEEPGDEYPSAGRDASNKIHLTKATISSTPPSVPDLTTPMSHSCFTALVRNFIDPSYLLFIYILQRERTGQVSWPPS